MARMLASRRSEQAQVARDIEREGKPSPRRIKRA
jgi:hypothetical protein